jgi:hypothetical protein
MLTEKDKISCEYVDLCHYDMIPNIVRCIGAESYLEIGCADNTCFGKVQATKKIGVDPERGGTHRMTSDEFFRTNKEKFDVIFIDGMHTYQQVKVDFENAKRFSNEKGIVIFHDVLPDNRYTAWPTKKGRPKPKGVVAWNGDVWRINFDLLEAPGMDYRIVPNLHGMGILKFGGTQQISFPKNRDTWEFFHDNWTAIPTLKSNTEIENFLQ